MPDLKDGGVYVNISKTLEAALNAAEEAKAKAEKAKATKVAAEATTVVAKEAKRRSSQLNLTEEQKRFIGVIAGEAIEANEKTWKAVAHTIMNRYNEPRDKWSNVKSVTDVLTKSQYDAVGEEEYVYMLDYLNNRDGSDILYERLIAAVLPIYAGFESDFTGGAHYIFNAEIRGAAEFEERLKSQPDRYKRINPVSGIDDNKFRMYRCLW